MGTVRSVDIGLTCGPIPEFEQLYTAGVRTVLNLETQTRELIGFGDPNREIKECQKYNVIYFDYAFSGLFPPRQDDVNSALGCLMYGIRPMYFHCRAGRERTGFMVAVYRMHVQGWAFERAYAEWKLVCRWPTYWFWKKALKKWERK